MVCIPTICPIHRVSMEDHCWTCLSGEFPIVVITSRGFRLVCPRCGRPLATSDMPKKAALIPQVEVLQRFESALSRALRNEGSLQFPGASVLAAAKEWGMAAAKEWARPPRDDGGGSVGNPTKLIKLFAAV